MKFLPRIVGTLFAHAPGEIPQEVPDYRERSEQRSARRWTSTQSVHALVLLLASTIGCEERQQATRSEPNVRSGADLAAPDAGSAKVTRRARRAVGSAARAPASAQSAQSLHDAGATDANSPHSDKAASAEAWLGDAGCVTVQRCPGVPGPCKHQCSAYPSACLDDPSCRCLLRALCGRAGAGFCRQRLVQCFEP